LTKNYEDKSLDADIHLDWQKRTVKFENSVHIWNKKFLRMLLIGSTILSAFTFFMMQLLNYGVFLQLENYRVNPPTTEQIISRLHYVSSSEIALATIGIFLFVFLGLPLYDWVASHPKARSTVLRLKAGKYPHLYKIENPSGTLTFDLYCANPLVDLEFSNSVSDNLESASMIKIKLNKHKSRKQMVIKMKAPATGVLLIKEY
jgi:hypothetical protein